MCRQFEKVNLTLVGFGPTRGTALPTDEIAADCQAILARDPSDQSARLQLARADIAYGHFEDADRQLAILDQANRGDAMRLRGYLRDLGYINGSREFEAAQAFYDRAIARGDIVALDMRARGWSDTTVNSPDEPPQAIELLKKAIVADYPPAMEDLAGLIEGGYVPGKTVADAVALVEKAAAAGWSPAILRLGTYYARGYGVTRDPVRADELLHKALAISPFVKGPMAGFDEFPPP